MTFPTPSNCVRSPALAVFIFIRPESTSSSTANFPISNLIGGRDFWYMMRVMPMRSVKIRNMIIPLSVLVRLNMGLFESNNYIDEFIGNDYEIFNSLVLHYSLDFWIGQNF